MARNTEQILEQINDEAGKYPELADLQSNNSKVSIWGYTKQTIAFAIHYLERLYDELKAEIEIKIQITEIGTKAWYEAEAKAYQFGDALFLNEANILGYANQDPDKKIIGFASVRETKNAGEILLKIVNKDKKPLKPEELAGFKVYMQQKKIIGTKIDYRSAKIDTIRLEMKIKVDAQIFNDKGERLADGKKVLKEMINDYLEKIPFDTPFYIGRLTDKILDTEGVKDFKLTSQQFRTSEGGDWEDLPRRYESFSGLVRIDFGTEPKQTNLKYEI